MTSGTKGRFLSRLIAATATATVVFASSFAAVSAPPAAKVYPRTFPERKDTAPKTAVDSFSASAKERLAKAQAELREAEELIGTGWTNSPAGVSVQDMALRRALLHRLVWLLKQQLTTEEDLQEAQKRKEEAAGEAKSWTRFAEPPPYSILLADKLREALQAERDKVTSEQRTIETFEQLFDENRESLSKSEEKIRQLNEQLEKRSESVNAAGVAWLRDIERLRSQVAATTISVLDGERRMRQTISGESQIRIGLLQRQLVLAEADATFTQIDLETVSGRIDSASRKLGVELADAEHRLDTATRKLNSERAASGGLAEGVATIQERSAESEKLEALEAERQTAGMAVRVLRMLQEIESVERTMWEMRFLVHNNRKANVVAEGKRKLEEFNRRLEIWMNYPRQELLTTLSQIELQEGHIQTLPEDSPLLPHARARLQALRDRDQLLTRLSRRIEQVARMSQRWAEGLESAEGRLPLTGRLQSLFSDTGSFFQKLWTFELFTAEDTIEVEGQKITGRRSVTFGKIAMAVFIFAFGIWLIGVVSRIVEPVILKRMQIEANQARLIRRWVQTFLVVCLTMLSLLSVKIPLTIFAFAGGALAIGLGFGMQTLLKNFVSGLILLFERPFRVGDVLDVSGQRGTVTEIGLRSSVLQLWDGTETLIPNSSLLENNVSNWTYSNRKVRFSVSVGVAYKSDTRRVTKLLEEVAERHGLIEKNPPPVVLFTDFGESSLAFELRFWVDVISANAGQIASDLRQMIASTFAENGIEIAFPQRDVHLDASAPLPVRIVSSGEALPVSSAERIKPQESI